MKLYDIEGFFVVILGGTAIAIILLTSLALAAAAYMDITGSPVNSSQACQCSMKGD